MPKVARSVDQVVGTLSRFLHIRSARDNTVADLGPYLDAPVDRLFPPPQPPRDLVREQRRSLRFRDRTVESLTWTSECVPLSTSYRVRHAREYACNQRAYAWWTRPSSGRRRGALIYVHGWLEPGPWIERAAFLPRLYEALGVDVLHVQLPFHGKRNPPSSLFHGELFWTGDLVRSFEAMRQACIDARTLVAWLRGQGYAEVGVTGISMGGSIAMVLACLAPATPDYVVPIVGHLELAEAVEEAPIFYRMKHDLEAFGIDEARRRDIFERLGLHRLRPVVARERQLWIMAKDDVYIAPPVVERQWRAWGEPPILWIPGGHMTFALSLGRIVEAMEAFHAGLRRGDQSYVS